MTNPNAESLAGECTAVANAYGGVILQGVLLIIRESEKISSRKPLYEEVGEAVKLTIYGRPNPNRP